jgi:hypothetical protein
MPVDPTRPRFRERQSGQFSQHIDTDRRQPHLKDDARAAEVVGRHLLQWYAKRLERLHDAARVVGRGVHPHVKSAVARGRPCTPSAYAPTIRKRTSPSMNARNRSRKS